jgi:hypothetical protein
MQIILNPADWTRLTSRTLCHEPSQTLFIVYPGLRDTTDHALPERLAAHAYPISDDIRLPEEAVLAALRIEAVLMLLFFHDMVTPLPIEIKERSNAA